MPSLYLLLPLAVIVLAIISLIRPQWMPTLISVAVLILGFIHALGFAVR